ncbi:MAG: hypothetical protein NTU49_08705 [Gammaproteobacteria bacterium]|nr:hypothetical protein [Gammaproteobacteria bacterium]
MAREWHTKCSSKKWTPKHAERILCRLESDVFPFIGSKPISEIDAPELLAALTRIENRGAVDTAHRAYQNCSQIFRYAIATGKAKHNICADLQGALTPVKQKHYSSIKNPIAIGELLRAINDYQGHFPTKCALQLALLFVRPGELRQLTHDGKYVFPSVRGMKRPMSNNTLDFLHNLFTPSFYA